MIWHRRGNVLYAERNGKEYMVIQRGRTWLLRWRFAGDFAWEVLCEADTEETAKAAAI
jgi:hypothetical protein